MYVALLTHGAVLTVWCCRVNVFVSPCWRFHAVLLTVSVYSLAVLFCRAGGFGFAFHVAAPPVWCCLAVRIIRSLIFVDGFMFPRFHVSLLTVSCFLADGFMFSCCRFHVYLSTVSYFMFSRVVHRFGVALSYAWYGLCCRFYPRTQLARISLFLLAPSPLSEALRSCCLPTYCLRFHVDSLSVSVFILRRFHVSLLTVSCFFTGDFLFAWRRFHFSLLTVSRFLAT